MNQHLLVLGSRILQGLLQFPGVPLMDPQGLLVQFEPGLGLPGLGLHAFPFLQQSLGFRLQFGEAADASFPPIQLIPGLRLHPLAFGLQIKAASTGKLQVALMPIPLGPGGIPAPGRLQPLFPAFIEALSCLLHTDLSQPDGLVQGGIARLLRMFIQFAQQGLEPLDFRLDLLPHGVGPLTRGPDLGQLSLHKGPLGIERVRSPANITEILIDLQGSLTGGTGFVTASFPLAFQLFQAVQKGFPCGAGLFPFRPQLDR